MVKLKLDNGKTVRLELVLSDVGDVSVIAVDKKGERIKAGYLCTFGTSGTMYKLSEVNDSLGFKLNKNTKIKRGKWYGYV